MKQRKTWREKLLDNKGLPRIEKISDKMSRHWGRGTVVIPAPMEVAEIMQKIPKGKLITINGIRAVLAERHGATIGCPMTTGIFVWIAARAAHEAVCQGRKKIVPYWRTLKSGGELNPKYPEGIEGQKSRLESEGHRVVQKGKRYFVENYEMYRARAAKR